MFYSNKLLLPQAKKIIAVISGKGGVGKSTIAVNISINMSHNGIKTGLLDADIYGPSIPAMLGIKEKCEINKDQKLIPMKKYGIVSMSIGFLINEDDPIIWRGPMVQNAIQKLIKSTNWPDLDLLVIDMPPGTGDIQLTIAQRIPLDGVIVVSTPQNIAMTNAFKGAYMFQKINVPILGFIKNMNVFYCEKCGIHTHLFKNENQDKKRNNFSEEIMLKEMNIPFLGTIPLNKEISASGDTGEPISLNERSNSLESYLSISHKIKKLLFPNI